MSGQRAAIYSRYSSREQDGSSTIESQLRECRTYARQQGLVVVEDAVFVDRAETGTTTETRDAFNRMIAAAQRTPRPFDLILVWKFSRFARNRELSALFKGLLRRRGVEVISVSEPVDRDSAAGILTEGMIEVIDQFYSARLAEDVRRGQTETTLEGFSTGGRAPFGYRRIETPDPAGRMNRAGQPVIRVTLEIEPVGAAIVRRIFESYSAGAGYKRIVVALNQEGVPAPRGGSWDVSTVREILRNPVYRGARPYGRVQKVRTEKGTRSKRSKPKDTWTVREAAHPPIVSQELWTRVQRRLDQVAAAYQRSGRRMGDVRSEHSEYLLTGILVCAACGGHFVGRPGAKRRDGGRPYYYGCGYNARRGTSVCANRVLLPREAIERDLLDLLLQAVLTPTTVGRLLQAVNARLRAQTDLSQPRLQGLREALGRIDREIQNFVQAVGGGTSPPWRGP